MPSTIQVGDKGTPVRAFIKDENGVAVDLSGATTDFVFSYSASEGDDEVDITVNGVVESAAEGIASYTLTPGDGVGEIKGTWRWQVLLTLPSGWNGHTTVRSFEALINLVA